MYTLSFLIEFILILSPSKAPPVFLFEGSTEIIANRFSEKSIKNRRTNSSTKEDLPAPPVPVIPNTGEEEACAICSIISNSFLASLGKFSAAEISRAIF